MVCHKVFPDWQEAIGTFGKAEHEFLQRNPSAINAFGSANPRWASPLWVRVLPVNGGFLLALILLWSQPPRRIYARKDDLQNFIEDLGEVLDGRWLISVEGT